MARFLKEQFLQLIDFVWELLSDVLSLFLGRVMVVELSVAALVKGEAIAIGAECLSFVGVGVGGVALGVGSFDERKQRSTMSEVGLSQAGEFAEGGEEIDRFDDRVRLCARMVHAGDGDDERRSQGFLEETVFTPDSVFSQVPAMITPENHDGVLVSAGFLEFVEDFSDVVVDVAYAGSIVTTYFVRVGVIFAGVLSVMEVLVEKFA